MIAGTRWDSKLGRMFCSWEQLHDTWQCQVLRCAQRWSKISKTSRESGHDISIWLGYIMIYGSGYMYIYIYSWDCIWLGYINYCIYKWTYRVDDFVSTMDSWTWKLSLVSGGVRCAWHAKMREMSRMVMAKCPSEKQYGTELFETQLKKYGCWCRSNFLVSAGHLGVTHHKKWIEMNRNG